MGLYLHISFGLSLLYSLLIFLLSRGLKLQSKRNIPQVLSGDPVTVIVPFRNEREHLSGLIGDLKEQSYAKEKVHVVLVNDHSTDGSGNLARSLISMSPGFNCVDLPEGRHGKKAAIAAGIEHARHHRIIQTDADCRIGPDFITAHMSFLAKVPSDLVAGSVTTASAGRGFMERFERLDMLSLAGAGGGSFYYRRALMCSGANLSYTRSLYFETRVHDPDGKIRSGDDMFLMMGARKQGKVLSFLTSRDALVTTGPASSLRSLIRQRARWGSKTSHYPVPDIQIVALLVAVANLMLLLTPLWIVISPDGWPWLATALGLKTAADFVILFRMTAITGQRKDLRWFLPASLLYYPYMAVILLASMFRGQREWNN